MTREKTVYVCPDCGWTLETGARRIRCGKCGSLNLERKLSDGRLIKADADENAPENAHLIRCSHGFYSHHGCTDAQENTWFILDIGSVPNMAVKAHSPEEVRDTLKIVAATDAEIDALERQGKIVKACI